MSRCVSCRVEGRRERLGDFVRRIPRITTWLTIAGWVGFAGFMIGIAIAGEHRQTRYESHGDLALTLAGIALVSSLLSLLARATLLRFEPNLRRRSLATIPHVVLPREETGGPAVDPASGSAYRSAKPRAPKPPATLCARHEALARQNQPRA